MKILVTGGAGFIGSNFVRRTIEDALPGLEGAEVVVLDALTYSGNLANLFEMPVLYFALVPLLMLTGLDTFAQFILACAFVSRASHIVTYDQPDAVIAETLRFLDEVAPANTGSD